MARISLLVVPENGRVRALAVSKKALRWGLALALGVLIGVGGLAWWGWQAEREVIEARAQVERLSAQLAELRRQAAELQKQLSAERKKGEVYARRIGQLQARLARLDALGGHLVQVAGIDLDDLGLEGAPAFGGSSPQVAASPVVLDDLIDRLDAQSDWLDAQLAVIEAQLMERYSEDRLRPHAWPTEGGWISSGFGRRIDPFTGKVAPHRGVDIANRYGAPVFAASRGVVVFAGRTKDFGYLVEIDHGYGYRTRYGHLSAIQVQPGDIVEEGQLIGRVGSSGRSTGPHLHYEVHYFGRAVDPQRFLPKG